MKQVEEAIAENAKGILASTMKEEINQLVKESLSEQDDEDEIETDADIDMDADNDDADIDMDADNDEMDMDMDVDTDMNVDTDMDLDMDSQESPIDLTDASDEEILKVFKAMGENDGIIVKKDGDNIHLTDGDADVEYIVKLKESVDEMEEQEMEDYNGETDESVDDVINAIFSKDKHTSKNNFSDSDDEDEFEDEEVMYEITLDDDGEDDEDDSMEMDEDDSMEMDEDDSMEDDNMMESKNTIKPKGVGMGKPKFDYKKTTGGFKEDMKQGPKSVGTGKAKFDYKKGANMEGKSKVVKAETKEGQGYKDKEDERLSMKHGKIASKDLKTTKARRDDAGFEKSETKEAARTYGMGSKEGRGLRKGITNNRNYVYGNSGVKTESTQEEVRMLREKNEEYRKALNVFREKLTEVAIFNSNLAYATRLFTEHSTTKKEKINILRRFDDVETLKESKSLYRSIKDELGKVETKSINESVGTKINKTVSTGSSTTLIESKTYENPQFLRMKDLMGKLG